MISGRQRTTVLILAALLAAPFGIRALYGAAALSEPYLRWNLVVADVNQSLAADLAAHPDGAFVLYRSAWYPWLMSLAYRLAGATPDAIRIVQWTLGAIGCLLILLVGRRRLGALEGWIAFGIASLFAPALFLEGELLEQPLATFLILGGAAVLSSAATPGRAFAAAALCAAAALVRPDLAAALPFLAAALLIGGPPARRGWKAAGIFLLVSLGTFAALRTPWPFIAVAADRSAINSSIAFHIGNNPASDGRTAVIPEIAEAPLQQARERGDHMTGLDLAGIRHATSVTGGTLDGVAPFWRDRALAYIGSDPAGWLALEARKTLLFFDGFLVGSQKDPYVARLFSPILSALLFCHVVCVPLGLILPLAVTGSVSPMPASTRMVLLAVPLGALVTTLVFFHDMRFQYPAYPFLILLAARGAIFAARAVRARRAVPLLLLAGMLIVSNADLSGAHGVRLGPGWFRVGVMHMEQGDPGRAFDAYARAIRAEPAFVPALDNLLVIAAETGRTAEALRLLSEAEQSGGPPVTIRLANALESAGRPEDGVRRLKEGLERFPENAAIRQELGSALARLGRCGEALPHLRAALDDREPDAAAFAHAAHCLDAQGDPDGAIELLREGRTAHPRDVAVLGVLGDLSARLGRHEEAARAYGDLLEVDPGNAEAMVRLARSLLALERIDEAAPHLRRAREAGHPGADDLLRLIGGAPDQSPPAPSRKGRPDS